MVWYDGMAIISRTCLPGHLSFLSASPKKQAHVDVLLLHQKRCRHCDPAQASMAVAMASMASTMDALAATLKSRNIKVAANAEEAKKAQAEEAKMMDKKMDKMCRAVGSLTDGVEQLNQSLSAAVASGVEKLQQLLPSPPPAYPPPAPAQPAPALAQPAPLTPATSQPTTPAPAQSLNMADMMQLMMQLASNAKK